MPAPFQTADYLKFYELAPSEDTGLARTWYGRGQNFIVAYTVAEDGVVLERSEQDDEYMLILPDHSVAVTVSAGAETVQVEGHSLAIIPPGASRILVRRGGVIVRIFTAKAADLAERCLNRASYVEPDPHVPPFRPWPAPEDGYRVRIYSLDVPPAPGRFGRIWRSSNLMVNIFYPQGPRDIKTMTPHHHDDFQQGLLILEGECVQHIRWPWTSDLTAWWEDEHVTCGSPSFVVIPPPSVHTTQMMGANNLLVDIFSPPREDFEATEGWVLNLGEYPGPESKG